MPGNYKQSICVNSFNPHNNAVRQGGIGKNIPFEYKIREEVNGVNDFDCYWKGAFRRHTEEQRP